MYKEFLRVLSLQPGEDLAQERTYHFLKVPDQRRGEREDGSRRFSELHSNGARENRHNCNTGNSG